MEKREWNFGVIGYGARRGLLPHFHNKENCRITAVADPDEQSLQTAKQELGDSCRIFRDYTEMLSLSDLDGIFILSPDYLHAAHTKSALLAGKHVYCEKPMALDTESADEVIRLAEKYNKKLFIGHNLRYFGFVELMKDFINEGLIGNVKTIWCRHFISYGGEAYFKNWYADRDKSKGLLLQKGAHDLDVIHWLAGSYTESVAAMGGLTVFDKCKRREPDDKYSINPEEFDWPPENSDNYAPIINVEDLNMVLMKMKNGVFANYNQCYFSPDGWRNYTIIGDKGRIENFGDAGPDAEIHIYTEKSFYPGSSFRTVKVTDYKKNTMEDADNAIIEDFIKLLERDYQPRISLTDARNVCALGEIATASIRNEYYPIKIPLM